MIRVEALRDHDADAARHIDQSQALLLRLGGDPRRAANLARGRAYAAWRFDRFTDAYRWAVDAVEKYERIDPAGVDMANALYMRAIAEDELHEDAKALASGQRAADVAAAALGSEHPTVAKILNTLAGSMERLGRHDEARRIFAQALAIAEATPGSEALTASVLVNLSTVDFHEDKAADAIPRLSRAVELIQKVYGPEHSRSVLMIERLGSALSRAGRLGEAETTLQRALAIATKLGPDTLAASDANQALAKHYLRAGQPARARDAFAESLRIIEVSQGSDSALRAGPLKGIGDAEAARGKPDAARDAYQRALAAIGTSTTKFTKLRGEIEEALAHLAAGAPSPR
jgi:tetratricopeptide (TPR) repeat protein